MNESEIDNLTGRELDAAAAERVMGWKWATFQFFTDSPGVVVLLPPDTHAIYIVPNSLAWEDGRRGEGVLEGWLEQAEYGFAPVPAYSTTWEGMGLVVEALGEKGWGWEALRKEIVLTRFNEGCPPDVVRVPRLHFLRDQEKAIAQATARAALKARLRAKGGEE